MIDTILALDGNILLWIQENLRMDWLSPAMLAVTKLGNAGIIWILVSLLLLCFKKTRWAGAAGVLSLLFSLLVNNIVLKNLVARTRPYEVVEGLQLLGAKAVDFSFPSGHTGSSFAASASICATLGKEKAKWLLLALAVLIAFTRLYIGIHYPTDVLCGVITGLICAAASVWVIRRARSCILNKK